MVNVGLTLPSFVDKVATPIAVARAAEDAGLDAVFAYDHLFRSARDGSRRPAIECFALLGALAVETRRIAIGSLVARVTLRPTAVLAQQFATLRRIAGARVVAAIGAGDRESRIENESFGLDFGSLDDRLGALRAAADSCRGNGYDVWVGGSAARVRSIVAHADGWNRWGGSSQTFRSEVASVREAAPGATFTWGGLVVLADSDHDAHLKASRLQAGDDVAVGSPATVAARLGGYVDAGASWLILAPIDSSDPANAPLIAEVRHHLHNRAG